MQVHLYGVSKMTKFHLISHHLCPYVQRAVIVLSEKEIEHQRTYIDLADKPQWFKDISPLGRVPILQTDDAVLFESQVIAEYLNEITDGSLHPSDPLQKARHRSWIEFGSETLSAIGGYYNAPDQNAFEVKQTALLDKFSRIEQEITGPYFEGEQFHMIDGVWGTIFRYLDIFDNIGDIELLADSPKTRAWRETVSARPSVIGAPPKGYEARLVNFLINRKSHLSRLIGQAEVLPELVDS